MSEEKKEILGELNISPLSISDANFDDASVPTENEEENFRLKMILDENEILKHQLEETRKMCKLNYDALHMLIDICKKKNFDPFEGEHWPFKKPVKDMTRDELVARNKEASERIAKTRGVDSKDKTPMPSYDVVEKKYLKETPTLTVEMENMLNALELQPAPAPVKTNPFDLKIVFASCKNPIDPDDL
jgi:hypothetical protein